jgi:UDP-N-acetylglucosamine:LPS N-acetylglucosamine transferase
LEYVKQEVKETLPVRETSEKIKILIINHGGGSGHFMPAYSMKKHLLDLGYDVVSIDVDKVIKNEGLLKVLGIKKTSQDIYNLCASKRIEKVYNYFANLKDISKLFFPSNSVEILLKKIKEINPDLILSTTPSFNLVQTSYSLNIPLIYVTTDFAKYRTFKNLKDVPLISNATPIDFPSDVTEIDAKIAAIGYPIRKSIKREEDLAKLSQIREELALLPNSDVIVVSAGGVGYDNKKSVAHPFFKIARELLLTKQEYEKPLEVVFICGSNESLFYKLHDFLGNLSLEHQHRQITFRIEGFVEEDLLSKYYKVSSVLAIKPGGSTTAEALKMGKKAICFNSISWELANQNLLVKKGLGYPFEKGNFAKFLKMVLKKEEPPYEEPLDWEKLLPDVIDKRIEEHRSWSQLRKSQIDQKAAVKIQKIARGFLTRK